MNLWLSHTVSSSDVIVYFPPEAGTLRKWKQQNWHLYLVPLDGFSPTLLPRAGPASAAGVTCCQPRRETGPERLSLHRLWLHELNAKAGSQASPAAISLWLRRSGSSLYNSQGKLRSKQLPTNHVSWCITVRQLASFWKSVWNKTKKKAVVSHFFILA